MKYIATLLILLITLSAYSQDELKKRHDRLKALKVSYITERLDLSAQEAEKFWPIYNRYQSKLHDMRKELRAMFNNKDDISTDNKLSLSLIQKHLNTEEEKTLLLKSLVSDLKPILSSGKIWKLIRSEEGFRRKLIQEYRKRQKKSNMP